VLCFWLAGVLSRSSTTRHRICVLRSGGDQPDAMTEGQVQALRAISAGAVMFGGLTYIGNAPI